MIVLRKIAMSRRRLAAVLVVAAAMFPIIAGGDEPRQETSLDAMRLLNELASVTIVDGEQKIDAKLQRQPVFRYSDQVRGIEDAGLWVWTHGGRPVAFQKVEAMTHLDTNERKWTYCLTTTSEQSVHVRWSDTREFQSKRM